MDETTNPLGQQVARYLALGIRAKVAGYELAAASGVPSGWPRQLPFVELIIGPPNTEIFEVETDYVDVDAYLDDIERIVQVIEHRKAKKGDGAE